VALVTGAARRIGRVIALELARAGFDIALHHRGSSTLSSGEAEATAAELRALGAAVHLFAADFVDTAATAALVPAIAEAFGRVDAVVNSASRFEYDSPQTFDAALLESLVRSNTAAPVALAQALAAQVPAQSAHPRVTPCVVNLLDQKLHNPNPDYFSYTLSKAALAHATVLQAQALAPAVRVCGVSPGITLVSGPMDEDEFARAHRLTALGRSSRRRRRAAPGGPAARRAVPSQKRSPLAPPVAAPPRGSPDRLGCDPRFPAFPELNPTQAPTCTASCTTPPSWTAAGCSCATTRYRSTSACTSSRRKANSAC
jgi:NAD(P)-dependent dehydrogenase (short-subunit alcohol dehydrogenase family)